MKPRADDRVVDTGWPGIDPKREGTIMCRWCQRQIQRCICSGPNDAPLDSGPNDPAELSKQRR